VTRHNGCFRGCGVVGLLWEVFLFMQISICAVFIRTRLGVLKSSQVGMVGALIMAAIKRIKAWARRFEVE
jgi:hypothetical protein